MTAKTKTLNARITSVNVRMYRAGTGDFFILLFKTGANVSFKMMIDCGCINADKNTFPPLVDDLRKHIKDDLIDLLVVTHEHADHINGFEKCGQQLSAIRFAKVWFSWTEDDTDAFANNLRERNAKVKSALNAATQRLNGLVKNQYYEALYGVHGVEKVIEQKKFIAAINDLNGLNILGAGKTGTVPTMYDLLKGWKVINDETEVEFLSPGDLKTGLEGATGMRFFILGPPRDEKALGSKEKKGESYEKREAKSTVDFSFVNAFNDSSQITSELLPFDESYVDSGENAANKSYHDPANKWRTIEHDWLYSAGGLAMRFEASINNTSLVLAIQFEDSENVLLFPGDAEFGNWASWAKVPDFTIISAGKEKKVNAQYLLNNTVFYKVGHHLSHNGSAKVNGIEMMTRDDIAAMATLNFDKIGAGWLNTMPNDLIGADLIKRTKGKLFFNGDYKKILPNIQSPRVSIKPTDLKQTKAINSKFDGKIFMDYEVKG